MSATKTKCEVRIDTKHFNRNTHKHTDIETHLNGSNGNILLDIDGLNVFQTTYKQLHIDVL